MRYRVRQSLHKELKSVIFSHVEEAQRLGAETLDQLGLYYLTEQTYAA